MGEVGEVKNVKMGEASNSMILVPEKKDPRRLELTTRNETDQ